MFGTVPASMPTGSPTILFDGTYAHLSSPVVDTEVQLHRQDVAKVIEGGQRLLAIVKQAKPRAVCVFCLQTCPPRPRAECLTNKCKGTATMRYAADIRAVCISSSEGLGSVHYSLGDIDLLFQLGSEFLEEAIERAGRSIRLERRSYPSFA
jgi:hypothetical protein